MPYVNKYYIKKFISLVLIAIYKRRKSSRQGILLTGLCDSGKTLIYSQLVHNKHVQTHTSIKENIGNYIHNNVSNYVSQQCFLFIKYYLVGII